MGRKGSNVAAFLLTAGACTQEPGSSSDAATDAAVAFDAGSDGGDAEAERETAWAIRRAANRERHVLNMGTPVRDVAIGRLICVLDDAGAVRCETVTEQFEDVPLPAPAQMLSAGEGGTCALLRTGDVACWGCAPWPAKRVFADDFARPPFRPTGVGVLSLPRMTQIAVGREIACGVTSVGRVLCWGPPERRSGWWASEAGAEICRGKLIDELPHDIPRALAVALSTGSWSASTWLLGNDHRVRVREESPQEEVDNGTVPRRWSRRLVDLDTRGVSVRQIATAGDLDVVGFFPWGYGCVLHVQGDVTCKFGFPLDWRARRRWTEAYKHGCALLDDGRVACWGYNRFGQAPSVMRFPAPAKELAVGNDHGCVLLRDGRVACWGANPDGSMGPPLTHCKAGCSFAYCDSVAHVVPDLSDVVRIRAGGSTTCAIRRDGNLVCWDVVRDRSDICDVHPG